MFSRTVPFSGPQTTTLGPTFGPSKSRPALVAPGLISDYLVKLNAFHSLHLPHLAKDAFTLCLLLMAECWRRLVHDLYRFPFKMFILLDASTHDKFLDMFMDMQNQLQNCEKCVDLESGHVLLTFLSSELVGGNRGDPEVRSKVQALMTWQPFFP